jgi:hypothetical protein
MRGMWAENCELVGKDTDHGNNNVYISNLRISGSLVPFSIDPEYLIFP